MLDNDTIRRRIGDRLRAERQARALTLKQMAETISAVAPVTAQAVNQWERGHTSPTPAMQLAVARALDVPWSTIFGLDGEAA